MEKNNSLALLRLRSTRAVIADGYRLFTNTFRQLFRASWPVTVVYALSMALMSSYAISRVIPLIGTNQILDPEAARVQLVSTMGTFLLTALLFVVCATVLASCGFSALREHAKDATPRVLHWYGRLDWPVLGRLAIVVVCMVVLLAIVGTALAGLFTLAAKTGLTTAWVAVSIVAFSCCMLLIPFCYTVYVAMLSEKKIALPFAGYLTGISHLGMLFITLLLTGIVTLLLTLIAQLPANILYAANIQSQVGMLGGDEAGMPEGMFWLNFIVFALAGFIQAYVHLSTLFPFYYAYGTITFQKKSRDSWKNAADTTQATAVV